MNFFKLCQIASKTKKKVPVYQFCADSIIFLQTCVFTSSAFRSSGFGTELASRHYESLFCQSSWSICAHISPTGRGEWMWYIQFSIKKNISSIEIGIKLFLECCQYDELCWNDKNLKIYFLLILIVKLTFIRKYNLSHSFFFTSGWKISAKVLEMRYCQNALFETSLFGDIFSFCPKTAPKPKFMVKTAKNILVTNNISYFTEYTELPYKDLLRRVKWQGS